MQIITQQELLKLTKILPKGSILKTQDFQSKLETFTSLKKTITSALAFLVMKIRKNIQSMYQKNVAKKKHVDLLLTGEREKNTMFLSMISIDSCMIIHYIEGENIVVIIV